MGLADIVHISLTMIWGQSYNDEPRQNPFGLPGFISFRGFTLS